jgi:hypothetical protein
MARSTADKGEQAILQELDAFVDHSIDAMSPAEFRKFDRNSKKTMADIRLRANDSAESRETAQPDPTTLGA